MFDQNRAVEFSYRANGRPRPAARADRGTDPVVGKRATDHEASFSIVSAISTCFGILRSSARASVKPWWIR